MLVGLNRGEFVTEGLYGSCMILYRHMEAFGGSLGLRGVGGSLVAVLWARARALRRLVDALSRMQTGKELRPGSGVMSLKGAGAVRKRRLPLFCHRLELSSNLLNLKP